MGMERRAPCKHLFCPYTHLWGRVKRSFLAGFLEEKNPVIKIGLSGRAAGGGGGRRVLG